MKIPLWLRLFVALALLSVAGIAALTVLQKRAFQRDFLAYVNQQALQRVQSAALEIGRRHAEVGDWGFVARRPRAFEAYILGERPREAGFDSARLGREMNERGPMDRGPRSDRPGPVDGEPGRGPPPRDPMREPGKPPAPKRIVPFDITTRVVLIDTQGLLVVGNPAVPRDSPATPVLADGVEVGRLLLAEQPRLERDIDIAFAQSQVQHAWSAGVAILVSSLIVSLLLARWLLQPVQTLNRRMADLAAGDFTTRIVNDRLDEIGELARSYNRLAETLAKNQEARRRWGADIAHELRTPLSILRGEIQAMQDGVRPLNQSSLQSLQAECERLTSLVEDLYQLALTDAGALEYRFETLDLAALVRDSIDDFSETLAASGLELALKIDPSPILVRGDARRLHQLIANIVTNSARYTDRPGRLEMTLSGTDREATLTFDDTPPGVPPEALPRLFERLFRVDASRSRAVGGAGLGLAICRQIAEAHQGTLAAAHSRLGGVCISLKLPSVNTARKVSA